MRLESGPLDYVVIPEKGVHRPLVLLPNLRDVRSKGAGRIGLYIADDILEDPDIARVVAISSTGVGKTLLIEELKHDLLQRSPKGSIIVSTATYEESKEDCEKEFGPSESDHVQNWSTHEWSILNEGLAQKAELSPIAKGVREVKFVELVGIGATQPRDRGVSALKTIALEEKEKGRQGSTLYLVLVPDLRVQRRAGQLREEILNANDEAVEIVLENNGITLIVSGVEERLGNVAGRKVKDLVRKNGDLKHIETINQEILKESAKLTRKGSPGFITRFFSTPAWSDLLPANPSDLERMRKMAFYLNDVAENIGELSGSPEYVYLLMNPLKISGYIYWQID